MSTLELFKHTLLHDSSSPFLDITTWEKWKLYFDTKRPQHGFYVISSHISPPWKWVPFREQVDKGGVAHPHNGIFATWEQTTERWSLGERLLDACRGSTMQQVARVLGDVTNLSKMLLWTEVATAYLESLQKWCRQERRYLGSGSTQKQKVSQVRYKNSFLPVTLASLYSLLLAVPGQSCLQSEKWTGEVPVLVSQRGAQNTGFRA